MTGSAIEATVVVPTYQRRESVLRLLSALRRQSIEPHRFEVILSVDGSSDGTADAVRGFETPFSKVVLEQENRGRAAACNRGVEAAAGLVVIILDDDMEPLPGFVEAHIAVHVKGDRIGVLGAVPIARADSAVARFVAGKFNSHLSRLGATGAIGIRDFYTGNFSVRRDVLLAVGGFDEGFRIYGNEDVELAVRLLESGVRLVYSAEAAARQNYEKRFSELAGDTISKGRTAVICAGKHPDVVGQLRIGTFDRGSRRWRAFRALALGLEARFPIFRRVIIAVGELLSSGPDSLATAYYRRALEVLFWAGVGEERMRGSGDDRTEGSPA